MCTYSQLKKYIKIFCTTPPPPQEVNGIYVSKCIEGASIYM